MKWVFRLSAAIAIWVAFASTYPAFASGQGVCSAKGIVTRTTGKAGLVFVKIKGAIQLSGDSSGCALKEGAEIEVGYNKPIKIGTEVQIIGSCSNGMTAAGAQFWCSYGIKDLAN